MSYLDKEKEQVNSNIYDYPSMQSFPVEDSFYQNLKRCKKHILINIFLCKASFCVLINLKKIAIN